MRRIVQVSFFSGIFICCLGIILILSLYFFMKPTFPEIKLVNESELQMPLRVYTKDKILIGEFGEIKRRPSKYQDIPNNIKNAFLAAEDDNFFDHQGISYLGLIRSFIRCLSRSGCQGGGGTITMQVVRGYLLTSEKTLTRKTKEIFLALELESNLRKEEIFELYVNRIFLGNRSYGIEAASNTYFNKNLKDLDLSESATIAAIAQLPSRVNPVSNPRRTLQRRNWILSRMLLLGFINKEEYDSAHSKELKVTNNINLYEVEASHLAELVRQEVIKRYGLRAYKDGFSVFTTIDSKSQKIANDSVLEELFKYDKRHGWREAKNYKKIFKKDEINKLKNLETGFLFNNINNYNDFIFTNNIADELNNIFDKHPYYKTHEKAMVIKVSDDELILIDQNFGLKAVKWSDEYSWARKKISINKLGPKPSGFNDFLKFGDFIYLKASKEFYKIDQIPLAESSLISINPNLGEVIAYIGGKNFNESNFDRVKLSYPQSGSSFKPFIYSSGLVNGYNVSTLINDAPIVFEDKNLESEWRPQNYTGEFYGPISLRDALIKSVNIVSIKLLREIGIKSSHEYISKFGFDVSRLPNDLSLALGSGNFSPAEMVRGYSVIANKGFISNMHFVDLIMSKSGEIIFSHENYSLSKNKSEINAFPWLNTSEMNISKPYYILKPIENSERVVDERISYLIKDILKGFLKNGVAGRKSAYLNRDDIGGKTGTTNDSVSTWFSGFHNDLVTTVWVGTDDFSSLGENEYGSTVALPIWLNYMEYKLNNLSLKQDPIPENLSFVKVNKITGNVDKDAKEDFYFELFIDENLN